MELSTTKVPSGEEVLSLYNSVGWSAYTDQPEVLFEGLKNSACAIYAYDDEHQLVGLVRVVSDNATICYVQDILVRPSAHRSGGRPRLCSPPFKRSMSMFASWS